MLRHQYYAVTHILTYSVTLAFGPKSGFKKSQVRAGFGLVISGWFGLRNETRLQLWSEANRPTAVLEKCQRIWSSCVWAAVQTKHTRSSSHLVLLMSGDRRSSRRFGGRKMLQSKMRRLADCVSAPQMHMCVFSAPQRCRLVPKRPTALLGLLRSTHRLRVSSEPDGRQTAG